MIHKHLLSFLITPVIALSIAAPSGLQAAGITEDQGIETAQYIEDREPGKDKYKKGTIQDYKDRVLAQPVPRFILGIGGALDAREGFGSASFLVPLGVQYGRFTMTFDLGFVYSNAKSLKKSKADLLDNILRTKLNGHVIEFNLPFKFSYSILDLEKNLYTPYVGAGIGYGYRKFYLRGSSALERIAREYSINSLMIEYGFGFLVRTSEDTRFNVGLTGKSYFNSRSGEFDYDTTGVGVTLGLLLIF